MDTPINVFSDWAQNGKDEGMERHHNKSVMNMIDFACNGLPEYSFIDAGCGNGWAVREMKKSHLCVEAIGIDGALKMIERAKKIDPNGNYICHDLRAWEPSTPVDIIHSMEVIYYFKNPKKIICHMMDKWLKPNGKLIMGLDFYKENSDCHDWPKQLNTRMTLLSINQWVELLKNCGLNDVMSYQTNITDSFEGTLVLYAKK